MHSLANSRCVGLLIILRLGSGVTTFIVDGFLHEGRLQPTSIRSAVLAGGGLEQWGAGSLRRLAFVSSP